MSAFIQVRHVPDRVHRTLKARAALAGTSLSEYVRAELIRLAERPTREELYERIAALPPVEIDAAALVREDRDSR
jgi:plasmid stability protein